MQNSLFHVYNSFGVSLDSAYPCLNHSPLERSRRAPAVSVYHLLNPSRDAAVCALRFLSTNSLLETESCSGSSLRQQLYHSLLNIDT